MISVKVQYVFTQHILAQSAEVIEYTDCISAEG